MPAKKINSNKNTLLALGPVSAIEDFLNPQLSEANSLTNVSDAVKWDGYDFNVEASEQDEDRALTDAAGAATRGYENYGGPVPFFSPTPADTSSIVRQARNIVGKPHTELAVITRDGYPASAPFAAGQVVNAFHVITDANTEQRGDKNRYYTVDMKAKGYVGVNRILPSSPATAVDITGPSSVDVGEGIQLHAEYEGNDITIGAQWVTSDEAVAIVTPHGIVIGVSNGEVEITATYPGSATGSPRSITVGSGTGGGGGGGGDDEEEGD